MSYAPIVIFSYNRPAHLRRVLEALAQNELANESELFIYCDGAKDTATSEQIAAVNENRKEAHSATGFKSLTVVERPKNIGLRANIVGAVTEIVNRYGRIITLEDDIITSPGFLRFMNDALEFYKDEERVMHVSAYFYKNNKTLPETFFYQVPYPGGGWGTWARAWKYYSDDTESLYKYWSSRWDDFNIFGGTSLQQQLEDNYTGKLNTWFIKWYAVMRQKNGLSLFPKKSFTTNIGFDGSGSNCSVSNKFYIETNQLQQYVTVAKIPLEVNNKAFKIAKVFKSGHWYSKRNLKAYLKKMMSFIKR